MPFEDKVRNLLSKTMFWQSVGSVSNVGGMACLALSPSSQRLIGKWYKWEIFAHVVLTLILTGFMLFAKSDKEPSSKESKRFWCLSFSTWKILIPSCVLIFSNVGSYYYDKAIGGKPDALGVISIGLLALSAVSLSRLIDMGFEVGFFNFFLAVFVVELVQIHWWLVVVGAIFCFLAIAVRVWSESPVEPTDPEDIDLEAGHGNRTTLPGESGQYNLSARASLNQTGGSGNGGSGVESVSIDMKEKKLTLTGDKDPVDGVGKLRKPCPSEIMKEEPKEGERKTEEPKKEERKTEEPKEEEPKREEPEEEESNVIYDLVKANVTSVGPRRRNRRRKKGGTEDGRTQEGRKKEVKELFAGAGLTLELQELAQAYRLAANFSSNER